MALPWPFAPLTTYVGGAPPAIKAPDLNSFQSAIVDLNSLSRGHGMHFRDDFMEMVFNTGLRWSTLIGGGNSIVAVDDTAAGGTGTIDQVVGVGGGDATIFSLPLAIGAGDDFIAACRTRQIGALVGGSFGILGGPNSIYWQRAAPNNWYALTLAGGVLGPAVSAAFQNLLIVRLSGTVYFFIDGVLYHTVADVNGLTGYSLYCSCAQGAAVPGNIRTDLMSLWVRR